ncbi:hypothetical protein HCEG_06498 [Histoplasma capsulatum var. duboisii H88]|uniref:Uncharacterized protein n=2 Tax=Ajellomyces capsulatus TaxID=5037 RepID=F0UM86_AJEC8|nr:predicted protein [Histoplasma capsulatum H143]EGC47283.1 hypothetical protein HCEG_06498 [Histoplasma capsulatum var. duboisii H88]
MMVNILGVDPMVASQGSGLEQGRCRSLQQPAYSILMKTTRVCRDSPNPWLVVNTVHANSNLSSGFMTDLSNETCWRNPNAKLWAFGHTHFQLVTSRTQKLGRGWWPIDQATICPSRKTMMGRR